MIFKLIDKFFNWLASFFSTEEYEEMLDRHNSVMRLLDTDRSLTLEQTNKMNRIIGWGSHILFKGNDGYPASTEKYYNELVRILNKYNISFRKGDPNDLYLIFKKEILGI